MVDVSPTYRNLPSQKWICAGLVASAKPFKDLTCVPSCIEPDPIPLDITKDLEGNWVPCLENEGGFLGVLILEPWDFGMFRWLDGKCGFQQLVERKRLYEFLDDLFMP